MRGFPENIGLVWPPAAAKLGSDAKEGELEKQLGGGHK